MMRTLLRGFLINLATLWATMQVLPGLTYTGGIKTLILGAFGIMVINSFIVPLLRVMFLPLNILTLGFFTWAINVIALYLLTTILPQFKIMPYLFEGAVVGGVIIPEMELNILFVAILASFLIGFMSRFLNWLIGK